MQSKTELYEQGLTTLETEFSLSAPSWANGWDGIGAWVCVTAAALRAAVPGLTIRASGDAQLTLLVKRCVQTYEGRRAFFNGLEQKLLNVVVVRDKGWCKLGFDGGTLELGSQGQTYIAGRFVIKFDYGGDSREVKLIGKLILQGFRTTMTLVGGEDWIPPFEVVGRLTLSASEAATPDYDSDGGEESRPDTAHKHTQAAPRRRTFKRLFPKMKA
jgi:hypothetical protein